MGVKIYAKHSPYEDGHLGKVVDEMKLYNDPTIRVVRFEGDFFAVEGSHRLAACSQLKKVPKLIVLEPDVEGLDAHWSKVKHTLPVWEFEHVLKMEVKSWELN